MLETIARGYVTTHVLRIFFRETRTYFNVHVPYYGVYVKHHH